MNHDDLRHDLAKRLRRQDVPDPIWDRLIEDRYIDAVSTGGAEHVRDLVEEAKRLLRFSREQAAWQRRQQSSEKPGYVAPDPGEYVTRRALARDDALALKAARAKEVQAFRDRFLGGGPISVPLARRLLASAAARNWPASDFKRLGIPIVGHRGVEIPLREQPEQGDVRSFTLKVSWDDEVFETPPLSQSGPLPVLHFVDEHGEVFQKEVWPRSVLDRLREISTWLVRAFGFDAAQATWFVLTDTPPHRATLEGTIAIRGFSSHTDGRVTLEIDPWVPADVVLQTYRDMQRDLLGRENRPLSLRNLAVYRTVLADAREAERVNPGRPLPSPGRSMARWNREHPEEAYKQLWQFTRDVDRAERAVLFPDYRPVDANEEEDE